MKRLEAAHRAILVVFAAMLGLFEGPAEIACVALLVTSALTGRLRGLRPLHPAIVGVALWIVAGVPGVITSEVHVSSQGYLRPLHALALFAGGFALRGVPPAVLARMAWAFGLGMVANGGYGLLQVSVGELPLDDLLAKKGSPQMFVPGSRTERCASGLFYNRIRLAHVGAMGLSLLVVLATSKLRATLRALATLGLLVLGAAMLLTYARMVLAAWAGACVLLVLLLSSPRRAALVASAGAGLAILVTATEGGRRRLGKTFEDLEIRGRIFSMAGRIFTDHPWLGAGHGTYALHARPMLRPGWSRNWTVDAHNLYLHNLAETGVLGFTGFIVAIAWGFVRLARAVRAEAGATSPQARLRRLGALVLLTFLVLGILHQPLHHAAVGLGFWFFIGLGAFEGSLDA